MSRTRNPWRLLRLGAFTNAITQSLFFIPFAMVAGSLVLSQLMVQADRQLGDDQLPSWFSVTVASSRSILSAVASGTITAASIVFSLTLVAVQLAASQFSPRVLRGFLGDRFQQIVMGTVIGTFSYSLFVLREVEAAEDGGQSAFTPQLSIAVALALAVMSLIAVLGSIDHTAKGLRVGSVVDDILSSTVGTIEQLFAERNTQDSDLVADSPERSPAPLRSDSEATDNDPPGDATVIVAPSTGWVTGLQTEALARAMPNDTSALIASTVGTYVVRGTPMLYLWPTDDDSTNEVDITEVEEQLDSIVRIGKSRTMQQDIGFGIVQLVDVALRALSPGVNDPHTAEEVIVRLGAVLTELYRHELPARRTDIDGRSILQPTDPSYEDYVDLAIEPIRRHARTDPRVLELLIRTLSAIAADARSRQADVSALDRQLDLIRDEIDLLETAEDRSRVELALDTVRS